MLTAGGLVAHALACFAFAALGLWMARRGGEGAPARWLLVACAATSLWALVFVVAASTGRAAWLLSPAETLRTAAWIVFLVSLLSRSWALDARPGSSFTVAVALGFTIALQLALDAAVYMRWVDVGTESAGPLAWLFLFTRLTMAIGGLVLAHNLFVNTAQSSRWSVRLLCIGLGGFFGYDLNLYTLQLLTGSFARDLFNIRGLADALVVPLIAASALRSKGWQLKVSRQVAFQTFSLAGIGGYLVVMSLLGYGLKLVGGDWGRLLQIGFIFATLLLAAVILVSGRFRAWARVMVTKHFFAYKYDYRTEWLRFITTLSQSGDAADGTLRQRVVQAVCDIVDSPGGALFTPEEGGAFALDQRWNSQFSDGQLAAGHPLLCYLAERGRIVNLDELRGGGGDYGAVELPEFAHDRVAWLMVPLVHLDRLNGFILMARPLAQRPLNWEDYDLLRTAGRQTASYIAESASQAELMEARKFDEFNRRFAFIMHDIKNVVSQLSLVARNAERHAENPEFRADMIATLKGSVGRMNDLLARLGQHSGDRAAGVGEVGLTALVGAVARAKRAHHAALAFKPPAEPLVMEADAGRLEQAFEHLVQNAIDATRDDRPVAIHLARDGDHARVDIVDEGVGMTPAFLRDELFRPFHSTKEGGFGIGAYEAREIVRQAGGRLSVASRPGEGSVFTVTLPLKSAHRRAA